MTTDRTRAKQTPAQNAQIGTTPALICIQRTSARNGGSVRIVLGEG
jgi:hypothetical protein